MSAATSDGLDFEWESGVRLRDLRGETGETGITAADVIPPRRAGEDWVMVFSAWQDLPPGAVAPPHPSEEVDAVASGRSQDFAAASIAADMAGYRSRIYTATSRDGLLWERRTCIVEGAGYGGPGLDAVHAEGHVGDPARREPLPDVLRRVRQAWNLESRQCGDLPWETGLNRADSRVSIRTPIKDDGAHEEK